MDTLLPSAAPAADEPVSATEARAGRLDSLDALRGLIVVLMAIDHASYFVARVHPGEFWGMPMPRYSNAAAFLTRFVTHLAAPGFFFLMGASLVFLAASRRKAGWTAMRTVRFVAVRGLVLLVLQQLWENPAWLLGSLGAPPRMGAVPPGAGGEVMLHFGVLYGLGAAMIVCALLLRAPTALLVALGAGSILLTQWLVPGPERAHVAVSPAAMLLAIPGHTGAWQVFYPLLPWLGVALLGMAFGRALQARPQALPRRAWMAGVACLAAFAVLRMAGTGDFHPVDQPGWIAFLNVTKYPPSLAFLLLTLGADLVLLSVLAVAPRVMRAPASPLMVFGQTALAFYLLHLYLFLLLGRLFPSGAPLAATYGSWLVALVILYPICRAYRGFKAAKPPESLWRLF